MDVILYEIHQWTCYTTNYESEQNKYKEIQDIACLLQQHMINITYCYPEWKATKYE